MELNTLFLISIPYFIGSIPFAFLLTKFFGYGDIRKIGSGNVGATNVLRTGKKSLAVVVLLLDIFKGYLPITLLSFFYYMQIELNEIIYFSSFVIIGHIFPIWLKFKGGKGVATYLGFILSIDYIIGVIFILFWILIASIKKYSSLASILSLLIIPFFTYYTNYNLNLIIILVLLSILIIIKHFSNIKRLLNKSEDKIKF